MIQKGKILILNDIAVDRNLPKYKIEDPLKNGFDVSNTVGESFAFNPSMASARGGHLEYLEYIYGISPTILLKFKIWMYKKFYMNNFDEKEKNISFKQLKEFFDSIKSSVNTIEQKDVEEVLEKYFYVLKNAEKNNQVAFVEKIKDFAELLKYELILSQSKFNKFLTEEDVAKFYNIASSHEKYKTHLCLTYVKNFIKIIPTEVSELKNEADTLKVFDNYVIMHYDYDGSAVEDTKQEKEKKKDPILFGLIRNSRKLYYIGDWVDDYCDLTLDVIIKKLGKKAKPGVLDSETLINNIDKI